jgi:multiple sugar transport system ATP-binding protein
MQGGVLQQLDTPQRLYDAPVNRFVAGFIGSPSMSFLDGARVEDGALHVEGTTFPLPATVAARLARYRGRTVVLGVRPEAVSPPRPDGQGAVLTLPVEVVEPLGSDAYVTFRFGRQTLLGRFDPRAPVRPGASAPVAIDLAAAHFFEPESGLAIRPAA